MNSASLFGSFCWVSICFLGFLHSVCQNYLPVLSDLVLLDKNFYIRLFSLYSISPLP